MNTLNQDVDGLGYVAAQKREIELKIELDKLEAKLKLAREELFKARKATYVGAGQQTFKTTEPC
jgi:hypothetical protein